MAIPATAVLEVQTGGSDTQCGGGFDPSSTGLLTNLAATVATGNSPVVTSASYNFVAGDVGAWIFIQSGTNWTPGWYKIASVAANAATVNATTGAALSKTYVANTVAGIATTASPTAGTGMVDYSQQATAAATGTATSATTTVTATTGIFNPMMMGNFITDGTTYKIITGYTSTTIVTVDSAPAWTATTIYVGGAIKSPGLANSIAVASNVIWVKSGTYTVSSTTNNIALGRVTVGSDRLMIGYNSLRADNGTSPVLQASGISTTTLVTASGSVQNIKVDGQSLTSIQGFLQSGGNGQFLYLDTAIGCTNNGFTTSSNIVTVSCLATGCSTQAAFNGNGFYNCVAKSNTAGGFVGANNAGICAEGCIADSNTGIGFSGGQGGLFINNVAYGNSSDGFKWATNPQRSGAINNIAEGNGGYGFNYLGNATGLFPIFLKNASYNNTSGAFNGTIQIFASVIALSSSSFVAAGSSNFALNSTSSAGASCRAAGIPGIFPGGSATGYLDIGAVQHADPAGGGGILRAAGMTGGLEG